MAKKICWLGILVMVLVFGMTIVGCEDILADKEQGGSIKVFNPNETSYRVVLEQDNSELNCPRLGNCTFYVNNNGTFDIMYKTEGWTTWKEISVYVRDGKESRIELPWTGY
jgi:hypothetical protein